jgi:hypothetical protein
MKSANVLVAFCVGCTMLLSACFHDDDDRRANRAPTATAVSFTTQADTVLDDRLTGSDPDNNVLTFSLGAEPSQGSVILNDDGTFTYLPNPTYTGTDQFTFVVSDGALRSAPAAVDIDIDPLQVLFSQYSRDAFGQEARDTPLPLEGREFTQDVTEPSAYDDLLGN